MAQHGPRATRVKTFECEERASQRFESKSPVLQVGIRSLSCLHLFDPALGMRLALLHWPSNYTQTPAAACRYGPGHLFGKHIDESMDLEDGKHTRYTVLVYLSGGVQQQPAQASSSSSSKKRQRASKEASSSSGPEATQQQQQPNDSASTQGESPSSSTSALQCLVSI